MAKEWLMLCPDGHPMPMVDTLVAAFNNRDIINNTITIRCDDCGEERTIKIEILLGVSD